MNGFMYKVARFFQGRYGIDKLFYGICGVAVVLSAANLFVRSLILQLMVYAVLVLAGGGGGDAKKLPEAIRGEHEV